MLKVRDYEHRLRQYEYEQGHVWIAYSGYYNSDSCSDAPANIIGVYGGPEGEALAVAAIKQVARPMLVPLGSLIVESRQRQRPIMEISR